LYLGAHYISGDVECSTDRFFFSGFFDEFESEDGTVLISVFLDAMATWRYDKRSVVVVNIVDFFRFVFSLPLLFCTG
jgi:hypothetical protein